MANIKDASIYLYTDNIDDAEIKNIFKKSGDFIEVMEYDCGLWYKFLCGINMTRAYLDKDEINYIHRHSISFAMNVNLHLNFVSYEDNEYSFEFLDKLLNNTKDDFLFLSLDEELIFERRNGVLFANKEYENFSMCNFNNCYELLKTEHINGHYYNIYVYGKCRKDVNELKLVSYDICKEIICSKNIKIIEYSDIEYAFSMSTQYFNFVIEYDPDKEQENLSEIEYVISVNIPFSEEFKDNRKIYAKSFIKNIAEHFEITKSNIFPGYKVRPDKTFEEYIDIALEIS